MGREGAGHSTWCSLYPPVSPVESTDDDRCNVPPRQIVHVQAEQLTWGAASACVHLQLKVLIQAA